MTLSEVVMILLTIIGVIITSIAAYFVSEFTLMRNAVDSLNIKISEVLARLEHHDKRIEKLEEKL